jgi:hypothetical protein
MRTGRLAVVILLGLAVAALGAGILHLAPALALFALLLARRYPGERHVVALHDRSRRPRARRPRGSLLPPTPRPAHLIPRGGLLLAAALAERGPPVLPALG